MRILFASTNAGKLSEVRAALAPLGVEIVAPCEIVGATGLPDVIEDGSSFEENAAKKARSAAAATSLWSLADDSGLEVAALGGAPGLHSARFSGPGASDAMNNALLLERLAEVEPSARGARFVCALVLVRSDGAEMARARGIVEGRILDAPRGEHGFGYDPLFMVGDERSGGRTFAELERDEKDAVSHRGEALRRLAEPLSAVMARVEAGPGDEAS